jgi:NAD(P) transhydrogenase subunit alpha
MIRRLVRVCAALYVAGAAEFAAGAAAAADVAASGASGDSNDWNSLTVLVLATFVGMGVIGRVSRLLHTPLMSLTNAISAISVVGSILITGSDFPIEIRILGAVALFASMTNIVSGFLITERMIRMFKERGEVKK